MSSLSGKIKKMLFICHLLSLLRERERERETDRQRDRGRERERETERANYTTSQLFVTVGGCLMVKKIINGFCIIIDSNQNELILFILMHNSC